MRLSKSFKKILYLGKGPGENYSDRKSGSAMGLFETSPQQMGYNYIVPGENGNRCDVEWFALRDEEGSGLVILDDPLETKTPTNGMNFSALENSQKDLHIATHTYQLLNSENDHIYVNIDHHLMGVGGDVG